jgi:hypothetical protein
MAPTVCRAENGAIPAAANFRLMRSASQPRHELTRHAAEIRAFSSVKIAVDLGCLGKKPTAPDDHASDFWPPASAELFYLGTDLQICQCQLTLIGDASRSL